MGGGIVTVGAASGYRRQFNDKAVAPSAGCARMAAPC